MAKHPDLPANLTAASWSQEKGIIAKITKKDTGIGAAMAKVETDYGQVDWTKFDEAAALGHLTVPAEADQAKLAAGTEYKTKVETLRKAVFDLKELAAGVAEEWKKSKLVPSSSAKHVAAVKSSADLFYIALKDNAPYIIEFARACDTAKQELSVEKIHQGELPPNWSGPWWTARAPRGLADDKLALKIEFFWSHHQAYTPLVGKLDDTNVSSRVNCLRQMIAGLDQGEAAIRATITRCRPGVHDHTKAALLHLLTYLPGYRQQRMTWINNEKGLSATQPFVKNHMQEKILGPSLDRL